MHEFNLHEAQTDSQVLVDNTVGVCSELFI